MTEPAAKKFRPSNGTEGSIFFNNWCDQCALANLADDAEGRPCGILGRMMGFMLDDEEYPKELIYQNGEPVCTAFREQGEEIPYRCPKTSDLFRGP